MQDIGQNCFFYSWSHISVRILYVFTGIKANNCELECKIQYVTGEYGQFMKKIHGSSPKFRRNGGVGGPL